MKFTTWNVNSINARIDHLIKFIKIDQSDVYLLQELKCIEEKFPKQEIEKLGYKSYVNGQKAWNGVAFLSKKPLNILNNNIPTFREDDNARFLEAEIILKQTVLQNKTDAPSLELFSDIYWLKNDFDRAILYRKKAKEKIKSEKSDELYYQYFLNSKSQTVTKLEYIRQKGIDMDIFKLNSKNYLIQLFRENNLVLKL